MSQEIESRNSAGEWKESLLPLRSSLGAVWILLGLCLVAGGLSLIMLVFQFQMKTNSPPYFEDEYYRDSPGAWVNLFGHLLRSVIGMGLGFCLWRYIWAVKRALRVQPPDLKNLYKAIGLWWNLSAVFAISLVLYAIYAVFWAHQLS